MGATGIFQGCFKSVSRVIQALASFNGSFKRVQGSFKEVSMKFQENVVVLFLKVYCCMSLIAATRADGGLSYLKEWSIYRLQLLLPIA